MEIKRPTNHEIVFQAVKLDESKILDAIEKLFDICQSADTPIKEIIIEDRVKCVKVAYITAD